MRYVKSLKMNTESKIHEIQQDSKNGPTESDHEGLPEADQDIQRQKSPFTASIQVRINRLRNFLRQNHKFCNENLLRLEI